LNSNKISGAAEIVFIQEGGATLTCLYHWKELETLWRIRALQVLKWVKRLVLLAYSAHKFCYRIYYNAKGQRPHSNVPKSPVMVSMSDSAGEAV